jgi:hypothetical protein
MTEIEKARAEVGTVMVNNTNNALKAKKIQCVYGENETKNAPMLELGNEAGAPIGLIGQENPSR